MMQNVMGGNGQMPPPGAMFNPNLPKKPMGPTTEQLDHLRHQKKELLERFGIDELSPIAKNRDGISDNPATTNNVGYNTFKKYSSTVHPWKRKNISSGVPGLHQEIVDFYKVKLDCMISVLPTPGFQILSSSCISILQI